MSETSAFRIRDFRLATQARFLLSFATQIQSVVLGWQIYEIKHDPLYLGLIGLVSAFPALGLALFAGEIVDRGNPLRIYRNVISLSFFSAILLYIVSTDWVGLTSDQKVPWIYAAAFAAGIARGFAGPSLYSLVPQMVPRQVLNVSGAWITTAFHIASVVGPALGGLLYAWGGASAPYLVDCFVILAAIASAWMIRFEAKVNTPKEQQRLRERLMSGIRYVFRHELLLSALALDMFAVLFGGATALLPIYAGEVLHVGPTGLGILRSAPAAGALLGSALLIRKPITRSAGPILLWVVAGFGVSIIGFGVSRDFWLSAFFLAMSGFLDSFSMVIRTAIVQLCSPDDMRGRIAAVNSMFIGSSNEIGEFESGLAAKLLGTVPSVIFGGTMTLLTVGLTAILAPRLRKMDISRL